MNTPSAPFVTRTALTSQLSRGGGTLELIRSCGEPKTAPLLPTAPAALLAGSRRAGGGRGAHENAPCETTARVCSGLAMMSSSASTPRSTASLFASR